jgi:hypothetical protein
MHRYRVHVVTWMQTVIVSCDYHPLFLSSLALLDVLINTVEVSYNNLSLCNTRAVVLYILWYQLVSHKALIFSSYHDTHEST